MKIVPSPLVSSMSGKTAGLVAASWKGRQYVRRWVIPHNPRSPAQTAVRDSLTRCVTLWRSLHAIIKAWLDTYGADYRMSGYNTFMSKNRALEQVPDDLLPVPPHPHHPAVKTFAAAEGAGSAGDIDCTWVKEGTGYLNHVGILCREIGTNIFTPFPWTLDADEALTFSGLTPGGTYDVYAWYFDNITLVMGSPVCIADVTAKAA